jgi:IclR family KDG regulon transcriptional repressor
MSSTILKGLQVVEYLAHTNAARGISEIARDIGMDKSAVQRILNAFAKAGYVEQPPGSSKYLLTLSIWELGSHVVARHEARRLVHPILRFGAQSTGFTAFLAYLSFPFVVYLDKVEGAHGRTYSAEAGARVPINRTAAGKAVLAFLPDERLRELGREHVDWTGHVQSEVVNVEKLQEAARDIRAQGYATSEGGLRAGVNSIAAPIWWREDQPYGSIILTADETSFPREKFPDIGRKIIGIADEATRALGGEALQRAWLREHFSATT